MKPTTEIWELHGLVQSYQKRKFDIVEENGKTKEVEDFLEQEEVTFNQGGFLISRKNFDTDKIFQYKWNTDKLTLKNFTNDDFVQILLFDSDDKTYCGEHTFKFNKQGFLIQENDYTVDGDLNSYIYYKNDDWGKPLTAKQYKDGELWMIENFEYDLDGKNVKSKITFPNDASLSYTKTTEYDTEGNVLKEEFLDPFLLPKYSYNYSYTKDNNNNWTKRFVYEADKLKYYETREINYFLNEFF